MPLGEEDESIPSKEALQEYENKKGELLQAIKDHSTIYFCDKSETGFVGLLNQGAVFASFSLSLFLFFFVFKLFHFLFFADLLLKQSSPGPIYDSRV